MRVLGYNIHSANLELERVQSFSKKELMIWQKSQRWNIVKYHYNNTDYYKNIVGSQLPKHWNELPILDKSDYQGRLIDRISKRYKNKSLYIANTSGSSGTPFTFAKNKLCHARTWAFWKQKYKNLGLHFNSKEARFYGTVKEFPNNIKMKIKDVIMNRFCFDIYDLSDNGLRKFIDKFEKTSFDYIYGYTQTIKVFSKFLINNNIILKNVCPSLKIAILTSELCSDNDRQIIQKGLGVPVKDEYGASEVGYLASECNKGNWHIVEENVFMEIHENKILVTDLFNQAQPFIRYSIGDLGFIDENNRCTCGDSSRRVLSKFSGRISDIIKLPSGKISPGLTFYYISRSLLENFDGIKEFIIKQIELDTFIFEIISEKDISKNQYDIIQSKMDSYLEPDLKLIIKNVTEINRPLSDKQKHFFSELK